MGDPERPGKSVTSAPWDITRLQVPPWRLLALAGVVALATWNLTGWPATWFDEGSHLMVPKALARYGVYADYDSGGFRYFGATLGVGPTVLLPIAAVFEVFGVGLLQARLVMAAYLLMTVAVFHALARRFTGDAAALVATLLLVTAPGVGTLEWGRQVLGEVPALLFLCLGMNTLVRATHGGRLRHFAVAGLLFGLAAVTKYQLLGVVVLGLALAWILSCVRDRLPLSMIAVPALTAAGIFTLWQAFLLGYLGPSSFVDNYQYVRRAAGGAALAFSVERALASGRLLLEPGMLMGALVPAVAYGTALALRGEDRSRAWQVLMGFVLAALSWFVIGSVGWRRYAYPGVALACIPAAALVVEGLGLRRRATNPLLRWTAMWWLAAMLVLPLFILVPRIVARGPDAARAMADTLNRQVGPTAIVATWEPEMTFLTNHQYRVPPQSLLPVAVAHVWTGGPAPSSQYDFMTGGPPDYVLEGPFAHGIGLYPAERLRADFELVGTHGPYRLYRRTPGP